MRNRALRHSLTALAVRALLEAPAWAALVALCLPGPASALVITKTYRMPGGSLPNNFIGQVQDEALKAGSVEVLQLTSVIPMTNTRTDGGGYWFDNELYLSATPDVHISLAAVNQPPDPNLVPVQFRYAVQGQSSAVLTVSRDFQTKTTTGVESTKGTIWGLPIDTSAQGLYVTLYDWVGDPPTRVSFPYTDVVMTARLKRYQIFDKDGGLDIEAGDAAFNAVAYENKGAIRSADAGLTNRGGASLLNSGSMDFSAGGMFNMGSFSNTGRFNGGLYNAGTVDNTSTITITPQHGVSSFNDIGGQFTNSGAATFVVAGGATYSNGGTMSFTDGTRLTVNGQFGNDGTLRFAGTGSLVNQGTFFNSTGKTMAWDGGTVAEAARLVNQGRFVNSGALSLGSGTLFNDAGATFSNTAGGSLALGAQAAVANRGTFNVESGSSLAIGGSFNNASGATFQVDARVVFGGTSSLSNAGQLNLRNVLELASSGELNNAGRIDIDGGTLAIDSLTAFDSTGTLAVNPGGGLVIDQGVLRNRGELQVAGGTVQAYQGQIQSPGRIVLSGAGGTASLGMDTGSLMEVTGPDGYVNVQSGTFSIFTGATTRLQNGAFLSVGTGGRLENDGTLQLDFGSMANEGTILNSGRIVTGATMTNVSTGKYVMTDGGRASHETFVNAGGLVQLESGTELHVDKEYRQNDGMTLVSGTLSADSIRITGGRLAVPGGRLVANLIDVGGAVPNRRWGQQARLTTPLDASGPVLSGAAQIQGNLLIEADGTLEFDVAGLDLVDMLNVSGNLEFRGGRVVINFIGGYLPGQGDGFVLIQSDSATGLDTASFSFQGLPDGYTFSFDGYAATVEGIPAAIPEPATALTMLLGLTVLLRRRHLRVAQDLQVHL